MKYDNKCPDSKCMMIVISLSLFSFLVSCGRIGASMGGSIGGGREDASIRGGRDASIP
jgi:hypothetical protein